VGGNGHLGAGVLRGSVGPGFGDAGATRAVSGLVLPWWSVRGGGGVVHVARDRGSPRLVVVQPAGGIGGRPRPVGSSQSWGPW